MEDSENSYNKKYKVSDLSGPEIAVLLKKSFFKVGIKCEATEDEWQNFVNEVRKWQGNIPIDIFEHSFSLVQSGEIEVKERLAFSPRYVSMVIKAQREKAFGKQTKEYNADSRTDRWNRFIKFVQFYGFIPKENWIEIWNHLAVNGNIMREDSSRIEAQSWSVRNWQICKMEVELYIDTFYSDFLHGNNIFHGRTTPGNLSLGATVKQSLNQ
jgi:hypothetical protein